MRSVRHRASVYLFVAAAAASVATVQCGTTGRQRVSFPVIARGANARVTNAHGWDVTVERAMLSSGAVRWYEGDPQFGQRIRARFALGVAHAHPGHYAPGEALADVTTARVVDLLAGDAELGTGDGVTGDVNSARVELRPAGANAVAGGIPADASVFVRGVARREGATVRFEAALPLDREVTGIPARAQLGAAPGRWEITVDVAGWVRGMDFATVPADGERYAPLPAESQARNALTREAQAASSFRFQWVLAGGADGGAADGGPR